MVLEFQDSSEDDLSDEFEARGPVGAVIERVEIRSPHGAPGRFVALDVSSRLAVTVSEIERHFGKADGMRAPNHHSPPDAPSYYVYTRPGEALKFGVTPGKAGILTKVILDRTE